MPRPWKCRLHGLTLSCPACTGGQGGKATSPAKQASSRANIAKATAVRLAKQTMTCIVCQRVFASRRAFPARIERMIVIGFVHPGDAHLHVTDHREDVCPACFWTTVKALAVMRQRYPRPEQAPGGP